MKRFGGRGRRNGKSGLLRTSTSLDIDVSGGHGPSLEATG